MTQIARSVGGAVDAARVQRSKSRDFGPERTPCRICWLVRIHPSNRPSANPNSVGSTTALVKKHLPRTVRAVVVFLLAVFDLTPFVFLLPVPPTDTWSIVGLVALCAGGGYCAWSSFKSTTPKQRALLPLLAIAAVLTLLTKFAMNRLPATLLDRVATDYIASLFGLDGEFAYDAALFEMWCELWLCFALTACAIGWIIRKAVSAKA